MGGTVVVLLLAGLVLPITMLLAAVLFDVVVLCWAAYRLWHDRIMPRFAHGSHLPHWMPHITSR